MKAIARVIIFVFIVVFVFGAAYAQFAKPQEAIQYRKAVMFLIAQHFKRMGAVVQGKSAYNKEDFAANAEVVEMLSTLPWKAAMEPGTDKGDTTMSSAVFDNEEQFREASESFQTAAAKLAGTARGGDLNAIKAQFGAVAQYCSSCHKEFRKK
ncbi:MAG: cytochrome c [Desulfobacterales bacterium]|nr:MAG: cytochrome c [Desulfobacterales bacterium]